MSMVIILATVINRLTEITINLSLESEPAIFKAMV